MNKKIENIVKLTIICEMGFLAFCARTSRSAALAPLAALRARVRAQKARRISGLFSLIKNE
jgi:hypothetical protein